MIDIIERPCLDTVLFQRKIYYMFTYTMVGQVSLIASTWGRTCNVRNGQIVFFLCPLPILLFLKGLFSFSLFLDLVYLMPNVCPDPPFPPPALVSPWMRRFILRKALLDTSAKNKYEKKGSRIYYYYLKTGCL